VDLNGAQRAAVESEAAPLCILAGAGSGKTRVLTHRIAHRIRTGTAEPGHVLALTFTRKAAGELRGRLRALGVRDQVAAGTFHGLAYAQLRRRWADRGEAPPVLLDRKVALIARLMGGRGADPTTQPVDVAGEIEWAKARMVSPQRYEEAAERTGRKAPKSVAWFAAIYARYEDEKRRRRLVDFDDLLLRCARAIEDDPEFAASQRWRWRHLFVDEFQDVNPVQFRLLTAWLGDRLDLCVVGDPNQAIYSWNGADPTLLTGFAQRYPSAEVIRLDDNYRSTPQVLAVANAVLGGSEGRLRANRPDGPIPVVRTYDSDDAEARGIARALRRAHRPGIPWTDLAVLVRTNAQAVVLEEALRAAGIPYRVRGGAFLDQPEIRDALAVLRRTRAPFASAVHDLEELVEAVEGPDANERRLQLEQLVRLANDYAALDGTSSTEGFLAWLTASLRGDTAEGAGDAVEITTFHRAKGLEWPVVFVAGLERGFVPIGHATTPAAEAEERRLLYVALTRAERELQCSWAERRTFGERTVFRSPSPWLSIIEDAVASLHAGADASDTSWQAGLAESRARLAKVRPGKAKEAVPDSPLLAALKAWRGATAQASKVPAYVIFHDSTLAAVASARPSTVNELLALPGVGPVKVGRYGDQLLAIVASHRASA
jgi:DNA helicase II / ATP-dependent DNA helicase PcrA